MTERFSKIMEKPMRVKKLLPLGLRLLYPTNLEKYIFLEGDRKEIMR